VLPGLSLLFVDGRALFCEGMQVLFSGRPGIVDVQIAVSVGQSQTLVGRYPVDVVVLAPRLPDGTVFDVPRRLRQSQPSTKILLLDDRFHLVHLRACVQLYLAGYWTKEVASEELERAIHQVHAGDRSFCPQALPLVKRWSGESAYFLRDLEGPWSRITMRELEVLTLIAAGKTIQECAEILHLSPHTVDNHKNRMMQKLGVRKIAELTVMAYRHGLVD